MSADNGIYILATMGERGKKEYRVAEMQAVENLFGGGFCYCDVEDLCNCMDTLDLDVVRRHFGNARVFTDIKIARGYAQGIEDSGGYFEYGIVELDCTNVRFPGARRNRSNPGSRQRRRRRELRQRQSASTD